MRPTLLAFTRHYLPGFRAGGPVRTVANMVDRLAESFEFRIVTLDRDLGDSVAFPGIRPGVWMQRGAATVCYLNARNVSLAALVELQRATPHDAVYLNSFFDPCFTFRVLLNRRLGRSREAPIVLAPRGELSPGALAHKRYKKLAYIRLVMRFGLLDGLTWQASSAMEADEISRALRLDRDGGIGLRMPCGGTLVVAPDIARAAAPRRSVRTRADRDGPLRICFLSRISPKKNLEYAIRVLPLVSVPIKFTIWGPIEDAQCWARCQRLIAGLPNNIQVVYEGAVASDRVATVLGTQDLFFFPTQAENFGHVIHEALDAGLPVLASDQTPWHQLETEGVGWTLPLSDPSQFAIRITEVATWSDQVFAKVGQRACALARRIVDDSAVIEANRRLFVDAIRIGTGHRDRDSSRR